MGEWLDFFSCGVDSALPASPVCLSLPLLFSYPSTTSSLCFCVFLRLPSSLDPTVFLFPLNLPLVTHLLCSYTSLTPLPMISPPIVSLHTFVPICPTLLSLPALDICSTFLLSPFSAYPSVYPLTTSLYFLSLSLTNISPCLSPFLILPPILANTQPSPLTPPL